MNPQWPYSQYSVPPPAVPQQASYAVQQNSWNTHYANSCGISVVDSQSSQNSGNGSSTPSLPAVSIPPLQSSGQAGIVIPPPNFQFNVPPPVFSTNVPPPSMFSPGFLSSNVATSDNSKINPMMHHVFSAPPPPAAVHSGFPIQGGKLYNFYISNYL